MGIFGRCNHNWKEVGRTFVPDYMTKLSEQGVTKFKSDSMEFKSQEAYDRWLHGFTNIELECIHCHLPKIVSATGEVRKPNESDS